MSSEIISAVLSEWFSVWGLPSAGLAAAGVGATISRITQRRAEAAREILLSEMALGRALIEPNEDEAVAVTLRYMRAAQEGTARLNLRLLAGVIAGKISGGGLYADEFLRWADILAGLKREEVITLGVMQRLAEQPPVVSASVAPSLQFWLNCSEVLQREYGLEGHVATAMGHALLRTGLVQLVSGSMETVVVPAPTSELSNLSTLLVVEGIIARDNSSSFTELAKR